MSLPSRPTRSGYDDPGVPGQRTVLVERGTLKTFLLSRAPVEDVTGGNTDTSGYAYQAFKG